MKTTKKSGQVKRLAPDSQKRLVAYTTAAGLGAFFAGQSAEAQVTASAALAPYPATLPADTGTNTMDFPCDVDGDGTNDFQVVIFGEGMVPDHSQIADIPGFTNSLANSVTMTNTMLNSPANNLATTYLAAWLGGTTIDGTTGYAPRYKPRLAVVYGPGILNNKFPETGAVGFKFVSGLDGQTHFGYMDVRVNAITNGLGYGLISSVVVQDMYYNATPNAGIIVPIKVLISSIALGTANDVTINFTSNTNDPVSAFTLETSPTLGPSANWMPDNNAVISLISAANPPSKKPLAHYQAVTTASGADSQFFRISR